jgi:hypothetical protein
MGTAREHEIRLMGFGLAAMALLAAIVAIWAGSTLSAQLRSHARSTPVTQSADGSLGLLEHS